MSRLYCGVLCLVRALGFVLFLGCDNKGVFHHQQISLEI